MTSKLTRYSVYNQSETDIDDDEDKHTACTGKLNFIKLLMILFLIPVML